MSVPSVAHVPGAHAYVRAVDPAAATLPRPFEASRVGDLHDDLPHDDLVRDVGVVHVHFGFEDRSPAELTAWARSLQTWGTKLVFTVHDIDNPHLVCQDDHHRRTRALVDTADRVVTLTEGAAGEIEQMWGRRPVVIPHPPILGPEQIAHARGTERHRQALVWLGTIRPNVDLELTLELAENSALATTVAIRLDGWTDLADDAKRRLARAHRERRSTVRILPRPTDDELASLVAAATVLVLPYRWGTHSGFVELATDVGTPTLTTPAGHRADQGAATADPAHFATELASMLDGDPIPPQRTDASTSAEVRRRHCQLYDELGREKVPEPEATAGSTTPVRADPSNEYPNRRQSRRWADSTARRDQAS